MRFLNQFLAIVLAIQVLGCTYTETLKHPTSSSLSDLSNTSEKIDLKVGVVRDAKLESLRFRASNGGHSVDITYGSAFADAVKEKLSTIFTQVDFVAVPNPKANYDVFAFTDFAWKETARDPMNANIDFMTLARLTFKDKNLNGIVAEYDHYDKIYYSPPATAKVTNIISSLSLYVLSPIAAPIVTKSVGGRAEELLLEAISKSVNGFGSQIIRGDLMAKINSPESPESPPKGTSKQKISEEIMNDNTNKGDYTELTSKYDHFLESVVVIINSDGIGTGFFVTSGGYILTNQHVVGRDKSVSVKLRSGEVSMGSIIETNKEHDLALIKINGSRYSWLKLSDGSDIKIGNDVLAIGTPKGLSWSVSKGIVSAVRSSDDSRYIQTDAAVNSGNSGGPLIDLASGRVIGINSFVVRKDMAEGLNFAISSEDAIKDFPSINP